MKQVSVLKCILHWGHISHGKIINWLASERCPKSKLVKCFSWIDLGEVLDADSMDQQGVALLWLFQGPLICKQLTSFMNGRNLPREWLAVLMETKKLTEPNDPFEGIANVWSTISLHSTWRSSWTKYVLKEKIYVALNVCGNKCTSSISLTIFSPWAHFALKSTLPWGMFPLPCNVKLCMVMTFKCSSPSKRWKYKENWREPIMSVHCAVQWEWLPMWPGMKVQNEFLIHQNINREVCETP